MRTKLLQVAADRGLFGQAKLREALRADEEQLTARIMTTLESQAAREALFELEGLSAQTVIDVLQDILEKGHLLDKRSHTKARRFMIKLSASFDKLPSGLFISGVTAKDDHPLFTGGFADIFQGSVAGKKIALKRIRILYHDEVQRQIRTEICKEALVWQTLQHLSILPFMGIDQDTFPGYLCLASPWMEQGTILKHLKSHGPANLGRLLFEIADGLQYLHSQNIVHGDLRGANILISNEWRACLADFGLASFSDVTASTTTSHNRAGSLRWMAPELINPEKFGQRFLRTPATDVYAFGCVCLELYTGEPPFAGLRETAVILKVSEGVRPERPTCDPAMSDSLWELVNNCWEQQSADRPLSEIVCQNFISTN
ncbi:kinase-like domain-containing protein [Mycena metata]|uniref:Kinase-like domain-containing protein n=1 Tax=Mycena metata TaxID=1033252 RepID=A0AAD7NFH1_9AGAR|nr:kinase-like domain-containing protein [Mycena metata]